MWYTCYIDCYTHHIDISKLKMIPFGHLICNKMRTVFKLTCPHTTSAIFVLPWPYIYTLWLKIYVKSTRVTGQNLRWQISHEENVIYTLILYLTNLYHKGWLLPVFGYNTVQDIFLACKIFWHVTQVTLTICYQFKLFSGWLMNFSKL